MGPQPYAVVRTLEALRKADAGDQEWAAKLAAISSRVDLQRALRDACAARHDCALAERQRRREGWRQWCEHAMRTRAGPVYRWVREGARAPALPPPGPAQSIACVTRAPVFVSKALRRVTVTFSMCAV